ncbi:MAG TPA: hypothetical protein VKS43_02405 [Burkholderiales bacterium]|nr:hypothetical protein [Burkholderiales bacterium]
MKRVLRLLALVVVGILLSACVPTMYVDKTLPPASKSDVATTAAPQPVQLLYEFQTRGSANARATESTRERVFNVAKESGLFSVVSGEPQANQHRLTVVINNVPITQDAVSKGVGVGLTFGLVGAVVTDGYECKAVLTIPGAAPVTLEYRHAIHSALGNTAPPPGLTPEPSPRDAVTKLLNQLMWSIMRDLSKSNLL